MRETKTKKGKSNHLAHFRGLISLTRNRQPWFDTRLSYNASLHRVKQALLHCAVVPDINKNPLPPPHPELLKYFDPPRRVIKRARAAVDECKDVFKIKEGEEFKTHMI
jgi:hypothetical protein